MWNDVKGKRIDNGKWIKGYFIQSRTSQYIITKENADSDKVANVKICEIVPCTNCKSTGIYDYSEWHELTTSEQIERAEHNAEIDCDDFFIIGCECESFGKEVYEHDILKVWYFGKENEFWTSEVLKDENNIFSITLDNGEIIPLSNNIVGFKIIGNSLD